MGKDVKKAVDIATLGAGGALAKDKLDPDLPQLAAPDAAPVPDDEAAALAARRKAAKRKKAGRAGTLLTEESTLG